jgi:hypothetical protein
VKDNFYIGEDTFRVWLPDVAFIEKSSEQDEEAFNSRQIVGIMSTERKDRQGETVVAKGLEFDEFLHSGHFNDNHSQATSAIVGYPESVTFHKSLEQFNPKLKGTSGWTCRGYVLKGTQRADGIWELAKALQNVPNRKLGFSIEGKVIRRSDKTIEKANIRNVAITNCPVNTDCSWSLLEKSFHDEDLAIKSMMAGYGTSPATQTGGGAIRVESLDSRAKDIMEQKKKRRKALEKALQFDDMETALELVLERRPDFEDDAAAAFVAELFRKGGRLW